VSFPSLLPMHRFTTSIVSCAHEGRRGTACAGSLSAFFSMRQRSESVRFSSIRHGVYVVQVSPRGGNGRTGFSVERGRAMGCVASNRAHFLFYPSGMIG
jgi:hypothetical protein